MGLWHYLTGGRKNPKGLLIFGRRLLFHRWGVHTLFVLNLYLYAGLFLFCLKAGWISRSGFGGLLGFI